MDVWNKIYGKEKQRTDKKIVDNIMGSAKVQVKTNIPNKVMGNWKKNDWDMDGVPDKKDCQPKNPMKQDAYEVALLQKMVALRQKYPNANEQDLQQMALKEFNKYQQSQFQYGKYGYGF